MKVLLVKCHKKTLFSLFEPIVTEPLELEYLSGLLTEMDIQHRVFDSLLEGGTFEEVIKEYHPDVIALTGYVTAVETIIRYSLYAKSIDSNSRVVVGGVHAEINFADFFVDTVDFIVHSDPIHTLKKLIDIDFCKKKAVNMQGIAFHNGNRWQVNDLIETNYENISSPNRSYFEKYKYKTKYMQYSPVATIKTALSCPHQCNFCYCRLLNKGTYSSRAILSVVEEMKEIQTEYIWIVDDSFLLERQRVEEFIEQVKKHKLNKKFIAYSRVDFIASNKDIIQALAEIGLVELIVGMEAVEDQTLEQYNKHSSANENRHAVEISRRQGVRLTALFIVGIDFSFADFRKLRNWIRAIDVRSYAVSIFTPLKGTDIYKLYEHKIIDHRYASYDFLHAVMKPTKMPAFLFYLNFYLLYVEQILRSKYIRETLVKTFKTIFATGGTT